MTVVSLLLAIQLGVLDISIPHGVPMSQMEWDLLIQERAGHRLPSMKDEIYKSLPKGADRKAYDRWLLRHAYDQVDDMSAVRGLHPTKGFCAWLKALPERWENIEDRR
jgi:hypothetical protein